MRNFETINSIWNDFCERFPSTADRAIDYYRSGTFEITILFSNSERATYDSLAKTIRYIKPMEGAMPEEVWRNNFSLVVSKKMNSKGMTNKELAERVGVSAITIGKYVNGKSSPSPCVLLNIADALGCSVSELIDFDI